MISWKAGLFVSNFSWRTNKSEGHERREQNYEAMASLQERDGGGHGHGLCCYFCGVKELPIAEFFTHVCACNNHNSNKPAGNHNNSNRKKRKRSNDGREVSIEDYDDDESEGEGAGKILDYERNL